MRPYRARTANRTKAETRIQAALGRTPRTTARATSCRPRLRSQKSASTSPDRRSSLPLMGFCAVACGAALGTDTGPGPCRCSVHRCAPLGVRRYCTLRARCRVCLEICGRARVEWKVWVHPKRRRQMRADHRAAGRSRLLSLIWFGFRIDVPSFSGPEPGEEGE